MKFLKILIIIAVILQSNFLRCMEIYHDQVNEFEKLQCIEKNVEEAIKSYSYSFEGEPKKWGELKQEVKNDLKASLAWYQHACNYLKNALLRHTKPLVLSGASVAGGIFGLRALKNLPQRFPNSALAQWISQRIPSIGVSKGKAAAASIAGIGLILAHHFINKKLSDTPQGKLAIAVRKLQRFLDLIEKLEKESLVTKKYHSSKANDFQEVSKKFVYDLLVWIDIMNDLKKEIADIKDQPEFVNTWTNKDRAFDLSEILEKRFNLKGSKNALNTDGEMFVNFFETLLGATGIVIKGIEKELHKRIIDFIDKIDKDEFEKKVREIRDKKVEEMLLCKKPIALMNNFLESKDKKSEDLITKLTVWKESIFTIDDKGSEIVDDNKKERKSMAERYINGSISLDRYLNLLKSSFSKSNT